MICSSSPQKCDSTRNNTVNRTIVFDYKHSSQSNQTYNQIWQKQAACILQQSLLNRTLFINITGGYKNNGIWNEYIKSLMKNERWPMTIAMIATPFMLSKVVSLSIAEPYFRILPNEGTRPIIIFLRDTNVGSLNNLEIR